MTPNQKSQMDQPGTVSGRRFIVALVVVILVSWGCLWLGFRSWRSGYEQRALAGRQVAHLIRPLTQSRPERISPAQWEDTVDHTEAMLIAVTGSNLLNTKNLDELGVQVKGLVERALKDPEQGPTLLLELWDDMSRRAGPVANIYGRPDCVKSLAQ